MKISFDTATISWLQDTPEPTLELRPEDKDLIQFPIPVPTDVGTGALWKIDLPMGMSLFCTKYSFLPKAAGQMLGLAEVNFPLHCDALMIQAMLQGRSIQRDMYLDKEYILSPGYNLFRYTSTLHVLPSVDCTTDATMVGLLIMRPTLNLLISEAQTDQLLELLEIIPPPSAKIHAIPSSVSAHLNQILRHDLIGNSKKLFIQARFLDYLTALCDHFGVAQENEKHSRPSQSRAEKLHGILMLSQGKIPTLDELAIQFNVSAQTLNEDFKSAYGQTIYAFMIDYRLMQSHAAIQQSNIPLKTIAQRLGYKHTNHFLTAFKKKFGYSPGSLRKQMENDGATYE